jgi:glycosyltransferase involved in cell wall biosynthesis
MSTTEAINERGSLRVQLDVELPAQLTVGAGTALFVAGSCWHDRRRVVGVDFVVDGERVAAMAAGMPRREPYLREAAARLALADDLGALPAHRRAAGAARSIDPDDPSYRSGFWATIPFGRSERPETVSVDVEATFADGGRERVAVQDVLVRPRLETEPMPLPSGLPRSDEPLIAICMATFDPPMDLFERQLDSILAQTHENWVCVISDDDSRPDVQARIRGLVADDPRFIFHPGRSLGFYRNFERALALAPREAELVALADQDDAWHPDKLEVLRDSVGGGQLAYSDLRVVDEDGEVMAETFFDTRPNNSTDLGALLMMNTVTGAATLFRRDLLERILPFPPRHGPNSYHDQWIALVALAEGPLTYVDRPLYDYVQHRRAVLGHHSRTAKAPRAPLRQRMVSRFLGLRGMYFGEYCRMVLTGKTLLLRCEADMTAKKKRSLKRVMRAGGPFGTVWLAFRSLRRRTLSNPTYGQERNLLRAVLWPRMVRFATRFHIGRRLVDGALPDGIKGAIELSAQTPPGLAELRGKIEPLELELDPREPERVNVLLPAIDLGGLFAGYIGIFNLARKLSTPERRARLVCFEWGSGSLPPDWKQNVERYSGLQGLFDDVEVAFPPDHGRRLAVNPNDRFVATTWWSAHLADDASRRLGRERFLYLIQDYEPLFYPWGTWHALAEQSYEFGHSALFSTEFLRDYFRDRGLGVFANGSGEERSASFRNAITPIEPPSADELAEGAKRRLLFYARLEDYSPRNLFDLGTLALSDLVANGTIDSSWELYGIGTVGGATKFRLGRGVELNVLPRQPEDRYADTLRKHDVGLSLMLSPHPSLVPLEMASAGMLVVTNSYANKTPEAMAEISENLITVEPTRAGIAAGIARAIAEVGDVERRARGAKVNWNTTWDEALDDELVARLRGFLDDC